HSSYQIELREQPTNLLPHECGLLAVLFPEQKSSTLNIAHLGRTYKRRARNFTAPVKQELAEMGLLDVRRQQVGKRLGTIGFGLLANWINRFQNAGQIAVPPWFGTLATSPDEHYTSFTRMMVHTSMINTSNSSGSGGGGGGGGVAGGGSSGAG